MTKGNGIDLFQQFGKRSKSSQVFNTASNKVVKYTRVSSKEQADSNCSLESQATAIEEFATRQRLNIIESFGGTYESAKTDGRLEFQRMLDFIKKYNTSHKKEEEKIVAVMVWHFSRFSRTGGKAIALADELREKYGVHIITVCNPLDTSNPHGVMMQDMQLVFSRWDNETRRENVISGMKRKFNQGEWVVKPPIGYDTVRVNGVRSIVLNKDGKLIAKAFEWKAQGKPNFEILEDLKSRGLVVSRQHLSKILVNPFYAGIMVHGMLEGKAIEGRHEKAISMELFLKANAVLKTKGQLGNYHYKESEPTPMRGFLKCQCGSAMSGYLVKKKWTNGKAKVRKLPRAYYKCNARGCNNNVSAQFIHEGFSEILHWVSLPPERIPVLQHILEHNYHEGSQQQQEEVTNHKNELKRVENAIDNLERKFYLKEEISKQIFEKFLAELQLEKGQILGKLADAEKTLSNPLKSIQAALKISSKLPEMWHSGDFATKSKLQRLVFPDGISFDKEKQEYRTHRLNPVFSWMIGVVRDSDKKKNANLPLSGKLATLVPRRGLEPLHLTEPPPQDGVSTSFTTWANFLEGRKDKIRNQKYH